jgi:putative two-component system response regulator
LGINQKRPGRPGKAARGFTAMAGFTVLVASADEQFASEIEGHLAPFGYSVNVVKESLQAIDLIRTERPDLVLAEVELPPLTGYELCQAVKQDPALKVIPFLLVADSYFDTEAKVKGLGVGADDLLYRPVHPLELRARIRSSLRLKAYVQQILEERGRLEELVHERTKEIEQVTFGVVAALERANSMNDSDTGLHIRRVSEYSRILGQGLQLEPTFVAKIARYASLHDVGKVGLPDAILKKEGGLTPDEFAAMKRHTTMGFEILKDARADEIACRIALFHHERYDGKGYPQGLSGYKIPVEARIVALADVYDALTTKRCYKQAMAPAAAVRTVLEQSGKHFDQGVVRVFMERHGDFLQVLNKFGTE